MENEMTRALVAPALVLVIWTLLVLFYLGFKRFGAFKAAKVDVGASAGGRGGDLDKLLPPSAVWPSHNYTHLLEQPTLFYAVVALLALIGAANPTTVTLAAGVHALRPDLIVDGMDLSSGMLALARERGVYRELSTADLTAPIGAPDAGYDAVVCVGTLTRGHLGPEPLAEMARVVRPGGVVVATVLDALWQAGGFRAFVEGMVERGTVRVLEAELRPYHREEGIDCRLVVLEVLP